MKTEPVILCDYCDGCIRTFAAKNPHADIAHLRRDRWRGCCRYWCRRGIPEGWWV